MFYVCSTDGITAQAGELVCEMDVHDDEATGKEETVGWVKRANFGLWLKTSTIAESDARAPVPWHRAQVPAAWTGPTNQALAYQMSPHDFKIKIDPGPWTWLPVWSFSTVQIWKVGHGEERRRDSIPRQSNRQPLLRPLSHTIEREWTSTVTPESSGIPRRTRPQLNDIPKWMKFLRGMERLKFLDHNPSMCCSTGGGLVYFPLNFLM